MFGRAIIVLAVVICVSPASAQLPIPLIPLPMMEGTPEDRANCEPDVRRYCQSALPDNMRVLACLQQNRNRISSACQGVLIKYGQ